MKAVESAKHAQAINHVSPTIMSSSILSLLFTFLISSLWYRLNSSSVHKTFSRALQFFVNKLWAGLSGGTTGGYAGTLLYAYIPECSWSVQQFKRDFSSSILHSSTTVAYQIVSYCWAHQCILASKQCIKQLILIPNVLAMSLIKLFWFLMLTCFTLTLTLLSSSYRAITTTNGKNKCHTHNQLLTFG